MKDDIVYLTGEEVMRGGFVYMSSLVKGSKGLRVNRKGVVLGKFRNRVLTHRDAPGGYISVTVNGTQIRLAPILCLTFHGPPPRGENVCVVHLDGPSTSTAERVRWGTRAESRAIGKARQARIDARQARVDFAKSKVEGGGIGMSADDD